MNLLKSTKQKFFNKKMFGFDIETYNDNKSFLMASIIGKNYKKLFYNKDDFIREVKTNKIFRNSILFATNLSFDFFGMFFNSDEQKNFFTLFRGSDLLLAKTYFDCDKLYPFPKKNTKALKSLMFLDSMNYAKLSVAKMGKIIGMSKLATPDFIGQYPKNKEEWSIMTEYNIRDSEVTYNFMIFLINSFEKMGATFKNTLASTSMSLFKNKYLDDEYYTHKTPVLLEIFKSYYGGRTEAFCRGTIKNYNYYDFNSLYPAVMESEEYPDPNTLHTTFKNTNEYINLYHGVSHVTVYSPNMEYPILPHRQENGRVIFPNGKFEGWYTHAELRYFMENGGVIMKVFKTHYYTKTCTPFKSYVNDLYNMRSEYKKESSPMEYVVKICMNSLYGKFGQKFVDKDNWTHESTVTMKELQNAKSFERRGEFMRLVVTSKPSAFCIPSWATYVTAYGRIKLHKAIVKCKPAYVDTDSLITKETLNESSVLGDLKLEMTIKEGIIVRPKFYALIDGENNDYVKIKGLGRRLNYFEFIGMLKSPLVKYTKFTKFKEALRRDLIPNQIIQVHKEFSLEDEKRVWAKTFNDNDYQLSNPITIQ